MTLSPSSSSSLFCAAVITAAHGVRGQVKVKCFLEDVNSFKDYSPYFDEDGQEAYKIQSARVSKNETLIVGFEGVDNRNEAEGLKGARLLMDRSTLPNLVDDTYYHQDLLGLAIKTSDAKIIGAVHALYNFGAGELLEIKTTDGSLAMIPFSKEMVPTINLKDGELVVSSDAAELLRGDENDA